MKNLQTIIALYLVFTVLPAQNASDYFPNNFGYTWKYEIETLDTLNEVIPEYTFYELDSLESVIFYNDKDANLILSKTGNLESINLLPYVDSNYVALESDLANIYVGNLLEDLPSEYSGDFSQFFGWYAIYDFNSNVNVPRQIFSFDTTITIDSVDVPLRFTVETKRLSNENLETEIGNFTCKKFEVSVNVYYLTIIPIKLFSIQTYYWLAPENWIVLEYRESFYSLSEEFGLPPLYIPGYRKTILSDFPTVGIGVNSNEIPEKFVLSQNYPNPFNPSTKIAFSIPTTGNVKLVVFNSLGQQVAELVNKQLISGQYEIDFTATNLPSGIYFYKLSSENYSETKKMILVK